MVRNGNSHCAAACAQVQNIGRNEALRDIQYPLHQRFSVGPGHQHARIHIQAQAKKIFVADDVGQRLTSCPAQAEMAKSFSGWL